MSIKNITLYFKEGASDKVYNAAIEAKDRGYVVNFAYGRRGTTLTAGTKTSAPVDLATATKIYEKLVKEKTGKGYTPGEDGTPYQQTSNEERATGIVPQLLNPIDESEVDRLIKDDDWWAQEKFDGRRLLIRKNHDGSVIGIKRKGFTVALPVPLVQLFESLDADFYLMDGEIVGDSYIAFDLLSAAGKDLTGESYQVRYQRLDSLVDGVPTETLRVAEVAVTEAGKLNLLAQLRTANKEGIVFKRKDATYKAGRPASGGDQLKHKFYATASCIVAGASKSKRSVQLELLDGKNRVAVGSVTVPPNQSIPSKGSIVEVRYLYAYPGGSLYQPTLLGVRDDIDIKMCNVAQLKFKAGESDDN